MIVFILSILLIALGLLWMKRISERDGEGDDYADVLPAFGLVVLGVVIFVVRGLIFIAANVHWNW